jgi:hypothetical protein
MGPVLLRGESEDGLEWAQYYSEENIRMASMDSVLLTGEAADGVEWVPCCSEENMRMALNGPSASQKRNCRCP